MPSLRSFLPDLLRQKKTPHPSQKQTRLTPSHFLLHTHIFMQPQGRAAEFCSSKQFCSPQSEGCLILPSGLHMLRLAGTLQSRWNIPGGQDRAFAKRYFPGTYDLMKFWQTFIAKGYAFIFFCRRILLPHILDFRPKSWPYSIFSMCWKIFQEAQLYHLPNNLF